MGFETMLIAETVGAFVAGAGKWVIGGVAGTLGIWYLKKKLPVIVKHYQGKLLAGLLNPKTDDPVEAELIRNVVVDFVKLAEYKLPDEGLGQDRKKWVLDALSDLGIPKAEELGDLIDAVVRQIDNDLKVVAEASKREKRVRSELNEKLKGEAPQGD